MSGWQNRGNASQRSTPVRIKELEFNAVVDFVDKADDNSDVNFAVNSDVNTPSIREAHSRKLFTHDPAAPHAAQLYPSLRRGAVH